MKIQCLERHCSKTASLLKSTCKALGPINPCKYTGKIHSPTRCLDWWIFAASYFSHYPKCICSYYCWDARKDLQEYVHSKGQSLNQFTQKFSSQHSAKRWAQLVRNLNYHCNKINHRVIDLFWLWVLTFKWWSLLLVRNLPPLPSPEPQLQGRNAELSVLRTLHNNSTDSRVIPKPLSSFWTLLLSSRPLGKGGLILLYRMKQLHRKTAFQACNWDHAGY